MSDVTILKGELETVKLRLKNSSVQDIILESLKKHINRSRIQECIDSIESYLNNLERLNEEYTIKNRLISHLDNFLNNTKDEVNMIMP